MSNDSGPAARGEYPEPADMTGAGDPLDLIKDDHFRLRHVCALMDAATGLPSKEPGDIAHVRRFLAGDLETHIADEEEDLFPLLHRRCAPEDEIDRMIGILRMDHLRQIETGSRCLAILRAMDESGRPPTGDEAETLRGFARDKRKHLSLENAILLPLARARLRPGDLAEMLRHMRDRRDQDHPTEG